MLIQMQEILKKKAKAIFPIHKFLSDFSNNDKYFDINALKAVDSPPAANHYG